MDLDWHRVAPNAHSLSPARDEHPNADRHGVTGPHLQEFKMADDPKHNGLDRRTASETAAKTTPVRSTSRRSS
jgi:hypothetical protein